MRTVPSSRWLANLKRYQRCLHVSAVRAKNPYFIYDLFKRQPTPPQPDMVNYGTHHMFDPLMNASKEKMEDRVKKVFGSLGSREESRKEAEAKMITVCGIKVPAKPEEPTNCCMSGCVNCVWELYKDEVEEWRQQAKKARAKLMEPAYNNLPWPIQLGKPPENRQLAGDTAKSTDSFDDGLDEGIRVFIETEKRLHAKRSARKAHNASQNHTSSKDNSIA